MTSQYEALIDFEPGLLNQIIDLYGPIGQIRKLVFALISLFLICAVLLYLAAFPSLTMILLVGTVILILEYRIILHIKKRKLEPVLAELISHYGSSFSVCFRPDGIYSVNGDYSTPSILYTHISKIIKYGNYMILYVNQYLYFPVLTDSIEPNDLDGWVQLILDSSHKAKFVRFR